MTLKITLKGLAFHAAAGLLLFGIIGTPEFSPVSAEVPAAPDKIAGGATATIEGIVIDVAGKPVENATVSAYINPAMNEKPAFVSMKTDPDGKYVLKVAEGAYYLKVSNNDGGGPPTPGQIVGYMGERTNAALVVKNGQVLKGVNFRVVLFSMRRGPFPGPPPAAVPGSGQAPNQR